MTQVHHLIASIRDANRLLDDALAQLLAGSVPDTAEELRRLAAQCRARAAYIIQAVPPGTEPQPLLEEIADQIDDALASATQRLAAAAAVPAAAAAAASGGRQGGIEW
jgi:hypothetical protein